MCKVTEDLRNLDMDPAQLITSTKAPPAPKKDTSTSVPLLPSVRNEIRE